MQHLSGVLALLALLLFAGAAGAVTTQFTAFETYQDFEGGDLHQTQLSRDGKLRLSRELKQILELDNIEMIWDVIRLSKSKWIVAGGHEGQILITDMQTTATQLAQLKAPEVTALYRLSEDSFLAAGAPEGAIYLFRIGADDLVTSTVLFKTDEQFIWELLPNGKGGVYAATGQQGKVYSIDREGKGAAITSFEVANVISLLPGKKDDLYLATQGPGRIYQLDSAGKLTAFYEDAANEVRKIALDENGALYAAINSDLIAARPFLQPGFILKPPQATPTALPPAPPRDAKGSSALVKIEPDGFVKEIWKAPDAPIHDLLFDPHSKKLLVSAGQRGHVYLVDRNGDDSLLLSIRENEVFKLLRIAQTDVTLLIANAPCVIYQLYDRLAESGDYQSAILDGAKAVRWGRLHFANLGDGALTFSTRAGNTAEPDASWTDWSALAEAQADGGNVQSPVSRFLQWRAEFNALKDKAGVLDRVEVFHIEPNQPPLVSEIAIARVEEKKADAKKPASTPAPANNKNKPGQQSQKAMAPDPQGLSVDSFSNSQKYKITWKAEDPNHDQLIAKLFIKGEGEERWLEVEDELDKNEFQLDGSLFAVGRYRVKVVASDAPSNPETSRLEGEWISDPFAIDGKPPVVEKFDVTPVAAGGKHNLRVALRIADQTSLLVSAQYLLNDGDWKVLLPADGIFDSTSESFDFEIPGLEPGQHVLQVLCTDREGNSSITKKLVTLP